MRFAVGLSAALTVYGNAVALLRPGPYTAANVGTGTLLVAAARRRGLSWEELGLGRGAVGGGLVWGGATAAAAALAVAVAARWRRTKPLFGDRRLAGMSGRRLAFEALVRIPFGTALFEEVAFRGVLLAAWARATPLSLAVAASSALFGLWHVTSTLDLMRANRQAASRSEAAGVLAAGILGTAAGGAVLAGLRLRSRSVVAPVLVHATANAVGTVAAFLTGSGSGRGRI